MATSQRSPLAARVETLERELPDRLEHREARLVSGRLLLN
jgi:hypothetical protein